MKGQQELFGEIVLHPPTHTHIHPHLVWWMDEQQELYGWIFFSAFTAVIIYIFWNDINKLSVRNPIMGCSPRSVYAKSESMFGAWSYWISSLLIFELTGLKRFSSELWSRLQHTWADRIIAIVRQLFAYQTMATEEGKERKVSDRLTDVS